MRSAARAVLTALLRFAAVVPAAAMPATDHSAAEPRWQHAASLDHPGHGSRLRTVARGAGRTWIMVGSSLRGLTIVGARARPGGSNKLPGRFSGLLMWSFSAGTFTPAGFAFAQEYSNLGSQVLAVATVVPLR